MAAPPAPQRGEEEREEEMCAKFEKFAQEGRA
jgi:hypothetical protein